MLFDTPAQPRKKSYYYINSNGKLVVLNEQVAFEQHNLHREFLGSSDDLIKSGFDLNKLIIEHFRKYIQNPTPPKDLRKETNYSPTAPKASETDLMDYILKNKEKIKELLKEDVSHNQEQKPKIQRDGGETDKAQNGQIAEK